ncbi:hypothetical protein [Corynebacterium confusum]|uniref:hypothetical protein n=1 Tax=Corynebacterium confusum TaxID=71254 RepID=UPI0025B5F8C9|nr:hypothetical protein [Corynebacterium confusum]WJY90081.1 hypothetical protein CCONF_07795 [Corynebacterium confusum]
MLIAALVLAFIAFIAFVNYLLSAATWSLVVVFVAAAAGIILVIIDAFAKHRGDRTPPSSQPQDAAHQS